MFCCQQDDRQQPSRVVDNEPPRHTYRPTDRHTDKQTDRQIDKPVGDEVTASTILVSLHVQPVAPSGDCNNLKQYKWKLHIHMDS